MKRIRVFPRLLGVCFLIVCFTLTLTFYLSTFAQQTPEQPLPHTDYSSEAGIDLSSAVDPCPRLAMDMCVIDPLSGQCLVIPKMCIRDPVTNECKSVQCPPRPPNVLPTPPTAPLIISEFRFRGPGGAEDEFVEIFNTSTAPVTVTTSDGSPGWALVASDGVVRFVIPNGTVIPRLGHFLGVNALGYSLSSYPANHGTTATGDASYLLDIPDAAGIALFRTANPASFNFANRLDSVGYISPNGLYREGWGFLDGYAETFADLQYSFHRRMESGTPKDTNNNNVDFRGTDVNGLNTAAGQNLGAPGPENLSSPLLVGNEKIAFSLLDPAVPQDQPPNRVRDFTPDPENLSPQGTMSVRRTITNVSASNITRLRFRIIDVTTWPPAEGMADLRARSSGGIVVTRTDGSNVFVAGTTLETPPEQLSGGGWNSTWSAHTVNLSQPLAPGASISVQFLLGIQQGGHFRIFVVTEALS